jgi:hypothetical protein
MTMILSGTDGGTFPSWTTAGRPASPAVGQMGYNTTIGQFDAYTSNGWVSVATSATAPVSGSTFSASVGSFSCVTSTNVIAPMNLEQFDVNGDYNNTGSTVGGIPAYAFKPSVAGYYLITYGVQYLGPSYTGYFLVSLYKNGSIYRESVTTGAVQYTWTYGSQVVYMDGVSDYVQIYGNQLQGTTQGMAANMTGALVRKA